MISNEQKYLGSLITGDTFTKKNTLNLISSNKRDICAIHTKIAFT